MNVLFPLNLSVYSSNQISHILKRNIMYDNIFNEVEMSDFTMELMDFLCGEGE